MRMCLADAGAGVTWVYTQSKFAGHWMAASCRLAGLLLHTAAVAAFRGAKGAKEFAKVELPNAKCLDGSPAVYYIAANSSSPAWVVWLEGGGICFNLSDCAQRAKGRLGSSSSYNASIDAPKGMLSSDPAANPDLYTWNRVFVPYCSGDVWMGTKRAAVNPFPQEGAWRGYFHGHYILEDMYEDISDRHVMSSPPTHAVLTGCSAGGMGVIFNCDWFAPAVLLARFQPSPSPSPSP